MPATARDGSGKSQEPETPLGVSHVGCSGPLGHLPLLPKVCNSRKVGWEKRWDLNPGTPIWEASVQSNGLTNMSHACPFRAISLYVCIYMCTDVYIYIQIHVWMHIRIFFLLKHKPLHRLYEQYTLCIQNNIWFILIKHIWKMYLSTISICNQIKLLYMLLVTKARPFYALSEGCPTFNSLKNILWLTCMTRPRLQYFSPFYYPSTLTLLDILSIHMDLNNTYMLMILISISSPNIFLKSKFSYLTAYLTSPFRIYKRHLKHNIPNLSFWYIQLPNLVLPQFSSLQLMTNPSFLSCSGHNLWSPNQRNFTLMFHILFISKCT